MRIGPHTSTYLRYQALSSQEHAHVRQGIGAFFVLLYPVGIFFLFGAALWHAAMPQRGEPVWADDPNMGRFGMLYSAYDPRCWWWELLELLRKLFLTGGCVRHITL